MKRLLAHFITASVTLLVLACKPSVEKEALSFKVNFGDPTAAREQIKNSHALCTDGICPSEVAYMAFLEGSQAVYCSGSLIADDLIITNAHCIPTGLRTAGSSCQDFGWAIFPKTRNFAEQRFGCHTVEVVSFGSEYSLTADREDATVGQLDYAVVRLSESAKRGHLTFSRTGFSDGERVQVNVFDPVPSSTGVHGIFRSKACEVSQKFQGAGERQNGFVFLENCHVQPGNSGGPVLSVGEHAQIKAVIFAQFQEQSITSSVIKSSAFAVNSACIEYLMPSGTSIPEACRETLKLTSGEKSSDPSVAASVIK